VAYEGGMRTRVNDTGLSEPYRPISRSQVITRLLMLWISGGKEVAIFAFIDATVADESTRLEFAARLGS